MIPLVWHPTGNQYTTQFGPGNGCGHHPAWQPHCCKETALLTWYLTDEYRISPKLDWLRNCNFGDAHEFAFGEFINYFYFFLKQVIAESESAASWATRTYGEIQIWPRPCEWSVEVAPFKMCQWLSMVANGSTTYRAFCRDTQHSLILSLCSVERNVS